MIKKKTISAVLLMSLFSFQFLLCAEEKKTEPLTAQYINKISIPEEIGLIKEVSIPDESKIDELIIYIQDAHCLYEAQMNICKIVKTMVENYGVKLINVEGTAGLIDTKPFSAFNDRKVKLDFADYFMKQGKITGPEYLSITSDLEFTIFGIENDDLYAENYTAYMNTLEYKDRVTAFTSKIIERLDKLKEHLFSPELLELDKQSRKYNNREMEFADYATYLEDYAEKRKIDLSQFKNFILQAKARKLEKEMDFKKIEEQRSALIEEFQKVLESKQAELNAIVQKSFSFKTREINADAYYKFLLESAKANNINLKNYELVVKYAEYLGYYNSIDKSLIVDEIVEVENFIKSAIYKNDREKELDRISRVMKVLNLLFKLEVVKADYKFFKENQNEFNYLAAKDFILKNGPQFNVYLGFDVDNDLIAKHIKYVVEFYEAALKRDHVLIENSLNRMKQDKTDRFVLVTGGFHTEGLTRILREQKKCYILIAPRITNPNAPSMYEEVMKAQADSVKGYGGIVKE